MCCRHVRSQLSTKVGELIPSQIAYRAPLSCPPDVATGVGLEHKREEASQAAGERAGKQAINSSRPEEALVVGGGGGGVE